MDKIRLKWWTRRDPNMNQKVYNKVCRKIGHDWAFKDCNTFMLKVCLNCNAEQYFFPEEVDE